MRILLVEDDLNLCESLAFQLEKEDCHTDCCHDGAEALSWLDHNAHDLILLDRMLPGMSGIELLQKLRSAGNSTPVILITALGELQDKIDGLDSGADDYIVKPFAFEELMARIRSIFRRPRQWESSPDLRCGDIIFQLEEKQLIKGNISCSLSKREADLMELFIRNAGQTLPRALLLSRVWGPGADVEDGNLDNYIHFIRRRLKTLKSRMTLKTIRGVGYCLEDPDV